MQTHLCINKSQPAFGIKVSEGFIKAAHNYYNGVEYAPLRADNFDQRVAEVLKNFGYDEFKLSYKKEIIDGKKVHSLYAGNEKYKVPITRKDKFRKVIDKFLNMKKGELYIKIKQFRHAHPELLPPKTEMQGIK